MERSNSRSSEAGLAAGVVAGALATLALLALRIALGGPSLPELIQEGIVGLLPGAVFSAALDQLKFAGKPLLFGAILVGTIAVGGGLGAWYAGRDRSPATAAMLALAAWLVVGLALLPALGQGAFGTARGAS